jgi:hypothetical protein
LKIKIKMVESHDKTSNLNVTGMGSGLFSDDAPQLIAQYYLNCLVYSKDRPYQLLQFLDSFYALVTSEGLELRVNVLYTYTADSEFEKYYELVKQKFPKTNFVYEDGSAEQIKAIINEVPQTKPGFELFPYFSFMVDDMIFFREISLLECLVVLQEQHKAYALHLKLSPGIYFSHTNNKLMHIPTFEPILKQGQLLSNLKFLKYRRSETELDWNYPFDFCGSIYRKEQLDIVLSKLEPAQMLKPNTFESAGN